MNYRVSVSIEVREIDSKNEDPLVRSFYVFIEDTEEKARIVAESLSKRVFRKWLGSAIDQDDN